MGDFEMKIDFACKVCGGALMDGVRYFCRGHFYEFSGSPECTRANTFPSEHAAGYSALMDFINRVRAELLNGVRSGS